MIAAVLRVSSPGRWGTPGRTFGFACAMAAAQAGSGIAACAVGMDMAVTKQQVPAMPGVGGPVTYRIVVANTGSATIMDMTVVDTISPVITGATPVAPPGLPAASVSPIPSGTLFTWVMQAATIQLVGVVAAATTGSNPTSLTIAAPPGVADGQVLLTFLACNPVTSPNLLAGWSPLVGTGNLRVYWRVAAGEPANYIWTCPSGKFAGAVLAYSGVDTANPIDTLAGQITAGTTHATPSLTTTTGRTMLVGAFMEWINNPGWTPDPGMVERADVVTTGGGAINTNASLEVADQAWVPAGATGTRTATSVSVSSGAAYLVALRPASFLYPGQALTFTITGQVGTVSADTTVTNTAVATAQDNCAGIVRTSNAVSFTALAPPCVPGLSVGKTLTPASPVSGGPVTYRIVVTNTGLATVVGMTLTDTLSPAVVSAATSEPAGIPPPVVSQAGSGTLFTWSGIGMNFGPGQSLTFTISGQAATVYTGTLVTNTAQLIAASGCTSTILNSNAVSFGLAGSGLVVDLGTAGTFGVLASTFTRNGGITAISGDLGYTTLGGSGSHVVSGTISIPAPPQAGLDQAAALSAMNSQPCTFSFSAGAIDLASDTTHGPVGTYSPGVYCIDGAMDIGGGGTITLAGPGTYIFRSTGVFNTSANSRVLLTGGALAADVFWTPGAATTLGANTLFLGTVIDDAGITVADSTAWTGRALAFGGAVTFDTVVLRAPIVALDGRLSAGQATISLGQPVQLMLTVTNTGPVDAVGVTARAWDAAGVLLAGPTPSTTAWQALTPGSMVTFTWTATPAGAGVMIFTASATGSTLAFSPPSSATVLVQTAPGLDAAVSVWGAPTCPGSVLLVEVTVTNTGEATANVVGPLEPLSSGAGSASYLAGPTPTAVTLAAGESITFTYTYTAGTSGALVLTTTATGSDGNSGVLIFSGVVASEECSVHSPVPAVVVSMTAIPSVAAIGGAVMYRIVVANTGLATITALTVMDTISPVLTGATGFASGFPAAVVTPVAGGGTVFAWTDLVVSMPPGMTYTFTISGRAGDVCGATPAGNTVFVAAASACMTSEMQVTGGYVVVSAPVANLSVVKYQIPGLVSDGQAVTYSLVIANTGSATITSLTVTDTISAVVMGAGGWGPASLPTPVVTSEAGTGTRFVWSGSGLDFAPGAIWTFTISGTVGTVCTATMARATSVAGGAACSSTAMFADAMGSSILPQVASLRVVVSQTPASAVTGEAIVYRIVVLNTGVATLSNIEVVDTLVPVIVNVGTAQPGGVAGPAIAQIAGTGTRYEWSGPALLGPGMTFTITLAGMVGAVCSPVVVSNTVWAGGAGPCGVVTAQEAAGGIDLGTIGTLAGTGLAGYNGDGIPAASAQLAIPDGLVVDGAGNVYVADAGNHRIRMVSVATGLVSTVAGTGTAGYNGDGFAATAAQLNEPVGVALDNSGNLYIADRANQRVRLVEIATGRISTVAGTGVAGYNGDGILAVSAMLNRPTRVAVRNNNVLYIADQLNHRIRKVDRGTGKIGTVAGTGTAGYNGDGIAATSAQLQQPFGVAVDASGNLLIADQLNHRVRRVDWSSGLITTIAGTGTAGYNGDGIAALSAQLNMISGVALDSAGDLFIGDTGNHRIRRLDAVSGLISTVAGTGVAGYNGDDIPATSAQLNAPIGMGVDIADNLHIADTANQRIRKVSRKVGFTVQPPVLALTAITIQTPAAPPAASAVTYAIVVTNTGTATVTRLLVTDTVSPVVTGATADQPPAFGAPAVSQVGSGTLFVWSAAVVMAPGAAFTFTVTGTSGWVTGAVTVSNTAYVQAGSSCSATALSTNPVSFTALPVGTILQLTVTSATSYDFGQVDAGSVRVSTTTFDLVNSGTVTQTLRFSVSNTAGGWGPVASGSPGFNECELDAQFNYPGSPGSWTASDHALPAFPSGPDVSTSARFAGNENGVGMVPGQARHLWLRVLAPSGTNQAGRQHLVIAVTAQTP